MSGPIVVGIQIYNAIDVFYLHVLLSYFTKLGHRWERGGGKGGVESFVCYNLNVEFDWKS